LYDQLGPTIVYSERTNEELEELFRTIIHDDEFVNVCHEKIQQYEQAFTQQNPSTFEYDDVSQNHHEQSQPQVIHEINMSVYYNVEVDKNNSDVTFVNRVINVDSHQTKKNRFSNLNLSNDIDRVVKVHDYVQHSHSQDKPKPTVEKKRHQGTISTVDETEKYDSNVLARIVEQQLAFAAKNKQFNSNQQKFTDEQTRHRVDHIEYPKMNLNCLRKTTTTTTPRQTNERDNLLRLGQQGILSSARAFAASKIPENIKTIELLEVPNEKSKGNFRLISYETTDNKLVRTNSVKQTSKRSPLKSVKHHVEHKNQTANLNKQVRREKSKANTSLLLLLLLLLVVLIELDCRNKTFFVFFSKTNLQKINDEDTINWVEKDMSTDEMVVPVVFHRPVVSMDFQMIFLINTFSFIIHLIYSNNS